MYNQTVINLMCARTGRFAFRQIVWLQQILFDIPPNVRLPRSPVTSNFATAAPIVKKKINNRVDTKLRMVNFKIRKVCTYIISNLEN